MQHKPARTDAYYQNGQIMARDFSLDNEPLPELDTPQQLRSGAFLDELASENPDDPVLNNAQRTYRSVQNRWAGLETQRTNRDPRNTRAAHLEGLARNAEDSRNKALKAIDSARFNARNQSEKVVHEAFMSKGIATDSLGNDEVRKALKDMNSTSRSEALSQAIEDKDTALLGAVINAKHPIAVGMSSQAELDAVKERALATLSPEAKKKRDAYRKAEKRLSELTLAWIENEDTLTAKSLRERYKEQAEKAAEARFSTEGDITL